MNKKKKLIAGIYTSNKKKAGVHKNGRYRLGEFNKNNQYWWLTPERQSFQRQFLVNLIKIDIYSQCPLGIPDLTIKNDRG
jgi:hypothetical protein